MTEEVHRLKILVIVYDFLPVNSGGARRIFRMLHQLGSKIDPLIITPEYTERSPGYDPHLAAKLAGSGLETIMVPVKKKSLYHRLLTDRHIFNVLDNTYARWKDNLLPVIKTLTEKHSFDLVFISVPPFSLTELVHYFKGRQNECKVVVDFRDAWSQWLIAPYFTRLNYLALKRREKKVLQKADAIITTSPQTREDFINLHHVAPGKIRNVYNSYEGTAQTRDNLVVQPGSNKKIRIVYVGSFYYDPSSQEQMNRKWWQKKPTKWLQYIPKKENWKYRSPFYFFQALAEMLERHPVYRDTLELHFAGKKPGWFADMVQQFNLEDLVVHHGFLTADKSLELQQNSDVLLITSAKLESGTGKDYSIAGKTFEYLQAGKPVLAFVTEGAQKDLLEEAGTALICNPDQTTRSAEKMHDFFAGRTVLTPDKQFIDSLSAGNVSDNLYKTLIEIAND